MATPLLATKLYIPPLRANLVLRPRLIRQLDEGLGQRLTLVSAPAGFGKTTLVTEWLHGADCPFTWLSLDEGDNDPVRFLTYLVAALQQIDGDIGQAAQSLLGAPQLPSVPPLVTVLMNDIAATPTPFALVLDDYHLIQAPSIHEAVRFLLEHQPPQMHLVIMAREDPPLLLPRLRARGQVTEIRERNLRFTVEEATAFLNRTMGLRLSPEAVAALKARTEGWIAGLQLAALSLRDRDDTDAFVAAFAGDDRHVMDYLVEEVLHRQPDAIQGFLLHTAILNRLSAPLCDALVSDLELLESSQAILEQLDAANLFLVPLDNKREWYRYHRLFVDLLRYRLRREFPGRVADLHRRASWWFEQVDDADEAIHHALAIPDFFLAAHLAEQYSLRLVGGSRLATYLSWVRQIPEEVITTRPHLCAHCGWAFVLTGQVKAAERYVEAGEAALADFERLYLTPEVRFVTLEEVRGNLAAVRAYCARLQGDTPGVIEHSEQALAQLPADAFAVRCVVALNLGLLHLHGGNLNAAQAAFVEAFEMALRSEENVYVAVSALSLQGDVAAYWGKLEEAASLYRQAIQLGALPGSSLPIPAVVLAHGGLALVHYRRDEMEAAAHHLEKALSLIEHVSLPEALITAALFRAQLALTAGDLAQAEALLGQAGELVQAYETPRRWEQGLAVAWGRFYLAQGDVRAAVEWIESRDLQTRDLERARLPEYVLLAHVLLAQGERGEASELLERLAAVAEASQHFDVLLETVVLQALTYHRQKDDVRALRHLERALEMAAPEGYVRPFLDAGEPMMALLRTAAARGTAAEHAGKLLAAFGVPVTPELPRTQPPLEPLSERELEVLRLVATGLSNRGIAQELVVAVSTVKSHINHIFGKLAVRSRTQAVARARDLGLL